MKALKKLLNYWQIIRTLKVGWFEKWKIEQDMSKCDRKSIELTIKKNNEI